MATAKQLFPKVGPVSSLSDILVRHYDLPNGTRFALCRKGKSPASRPFLRSDAEVRRKLFKKGDHPTNTGARVTDLCRAVEAMLHPASRHDGVAIIQPDGSVANGNMLLRTLRTLPARPTAQQRDAASMVRALIHEVSLRAAADLEDLEEAIQDPDSVVTEGMLQALLDRYTAPAVKAAVKRLRL